MIVAAIIHTGSPPMTSPTNPADEIEREEQMLAGKVADYVANYEFRGDEGDHAPSDGERALIEDAIQGFLADSVDPKLQRLCEALRAIRAGYPSNSNAARIANEALT
jgi:hypothetical protein